MRQRNLLAVATWRRHRFGQVLRDRIVQTDLAAFDHVGEQDGGEHLGDRSDFKDRLSVHRAMALPVRRAVADDAGARLIDKTNDDADALLHTVDAVLEDARDVVIGERERFRVCNGELPQHLGFTGCREGAAQTSDEERRR
jgi:hypothetical protein